MKILSNPVRSGGVAIAAAMMPFLVAVLAGCGGGGGDTTPSPSPSPSVSPSPVVSPSPTVSPSPAAPVVAVAADVPDLLRGQSATLFWNSSNAVEVVSSNFDAGTLVGNKVITPLETTTYMISVRNAGGQTAGASVEVRVAPVGVTIGPSPAVVDIFGALPLTAAVTGAVDTSVNWAVLEEGGGTINGNGVYSAPASAGLYHIRATSKADTSKTAVIEVRVRAAGGSVTVN